MAILAVRADFRATKVSRSARSQSGTSIVDGVAGRLRTIPGRVSQAQTISGQTLSGAGVLQS
jgi:hypothetical protein